MNKKIFFFLFFVALFSISVIFFLSSNEFNQVKAGPLLSLQKESFEQKRTKLLNELSFSINEAVSEGKYSCCIDPPCTMCYLGDWIWKDGTCDCDGMIAKGEFDKVCPQCKKGIEEGRCKSSTDFSCEI